MNPQHLLTFGNRLAWAASVLALAVGCSSVPLARVDVVEPPDEWRSPTSRSDLECVELTCFGINDARLQELINEALDFNHDLAAAAARLRQAQVTARIAGADRLPFLDASGQASRQQQAVSLPGANGQQALQNVRTTQFGVNLNLSWEVDLWGRIGANLRAAEADYLAQQNQFRSARLSLAAQTAKAWFALVESQLQLKLASETLESFEETSRVATDRSDAGVASPSDSALSVVSTEQARSIYHQRRQSLYFASRQLELLLGRYPAAEAEAAENLPRLGSSPTPFLPAEVLARRPDLSAAALAVTGSAERARAARAALLPRISLTGGSGRVSDELGSVLEGDTVWNISLGLLQPLFQGGRLRNQVRLNDHVTEEAIASFRGIALVAFSEVESALTNEEILALSATALAKAAEASVSALSIANDRYAEGVDSFLVVLESQRRYFDSQSALLGAERARLDNRVDFYLSIGGGLIPADVEGSGPRDTSSINTSINTSNQGAF